MTQSTIQYVISTLANGSPMSSTQIAKAVSRASGKTVSPSEIAGPLKKISDPDRSDLGHFVGRKWGDGTYVYRLVPEACALTEAQLYGLTRKRGAARYALADALTDHPSWVGTWTTRMPGTPPRPETTRTPRPGNPGSSWWGSEPRPAVWRRSIPFSGP